MFSTFQAFKFLSCKLAFLTSDPRIDRLRHGSCDASEGEVQSAGVVVVVFSVHFIDQQRGPGHVVVFVHFFQYGLTTLEEEKKYKSGFCKIIIVSGQHEIPGAGECVCVCVCVCARPHSLTQRHTHSEIRARAREAAAQGQARDSVQKPSYKIKYDEADLALGFTVNEGGHEGRPEFYVWKHYGKYSSSKVGHDRKSLRTYALL